MPVRLYPGARGERISFHLLHDSDHARLKQQMVCSRDGAVVPRSDTVRGYEYAKGEYVVISEEQIKAAAPATERQLEIVEFCRADEIDPVWFESSYYLMPEAAGRRAYAVLLQAMRESAYIAVAQLSMHNREYLSVVRPSQLAGVPAQTPRGGLLLHTLFYQDEIQVVDGFGGVESEATVAEAKMARQLIAALARPFDASRFEDHYRKNLEAVVAAALEGRAAPERPAAARLAPVTDLMASLKQSLAGVHAQRPPAREKPREKKAASGRRAHPPQAA